MFTAGVDLGQSQDYTALAVVERAAELRLRHLERLPLGTPYPAVIERVAVLLDALPGTTALVVDAGGPGRPVIDAMRVAGLEPIAVSITSGKRSWRANGMVYVPKRELVRVLVTAFENGRLKIAKGLPLAGALMGELQAFQVRLTANGQDTYAAFRRARRPGDGGRTRVWFGGARLLAWATQGAPRTRETSRAGPGHRLE